MRFNKGIHNILVERGIASENTAMLFMCFCGAIRQTNMATDSFNIYLSPVGVNHSTDSLLIGKRAPNLSGMRMNTVVMIGFWGNRPSRKWRPLTTRLDET